MRRSLWSAWFIPVLCLCGLTGSAAAQVAVSGVLSGSTTFLSSNTYLVVGPLTVPAGVTLTIDPGTTVRFDPGTGLRVEGTLVARGLLSQEICFTSSQLTPAPGDWGFPIGSGDVVNGIAFVDAQGVVLDANDQYLGGSSIEHAIVEYGTGLSIVRSSPLVRSTLLRSNNPHGSAVLFVNQNAPLGAGIPPATILGNTIEDSPRLGFNLQQGPVRFERNLVQRTRGGFIGEIGGRFAENTIACNGTPPGPGPPAPPGFEGALLFAFSNPALFRRNNFVDNLPFDAYLRFDASDHDLSNNYWGTIVPSEIADRIFDGDDLGGPAGIVLFQPFLTSPDANTPAIPACDGGGPAPTADAGADRVVECLGVDGAPVTLTAGEPTEAGFTYTWTGSFGSALGQSATVTLPVGTHTVHLAVKNNAGQTATDTVEVTVEDTTAPAVTATLVPIEVKRRRGIFQVEFSCEDTCDGGLAVTSATLNGVPVTNGQIVNLKIKNAPGKKKGSIRVSQ